MNSKLKHMRYQARIISTYDFSTLYTTHILIKSKLTHLIEKAFARENKLFITCNVERAFFTNDTVKHYTMWTCLDVCKSLSFLLDNIYVRFGDAVYRRVILSQ